MENNFKDIRFIDGIEIPSQDKQLEYVYVALRKQEKRQKRNFIFKIFYRCSIVILLVLFYFVIIPKVNIESLINTYILPKITPIVSNMSNEILKNSQSSLKNTTNQVIEGVVDGGNSGEIDNDELKEKIKKAMESIGEQ
ncbi:MAG: hypothetical protein PHF46_00030 [Candidatus Gracilibacteria bacterium]|nr:hypothetical protein [Candidatus Gracilibacteria bacterium]MDD4530834.1 hypothetical protein [Candidatus Gracilibacteria bacterium]